MAMFANQIAWLEKLVSGNVLRLTTRTADSLVATSDTTLTITDAIPSDIDRAFDWTAAHGAPNLLIWSVRENPRADLLFHARGCRESFRPLWMYRPLHEPLPEPDDIQGITIALARLDDLAAMQAAREVPYMAAPWLTQLPELSTGHDRSRGVWRLLAWNEPRQPRRIVGSGILHLAPSVSGVTAAIFNLGVDPAWQHRGIGTALTLGLCRIAREQGVPGVALNATPRGEPVYRAQGFVATGEGQTWHMPSASLRNRPDAAIIAAAEALGRGETARLDPSVARLEALPNGDTPIRFAVRFRQPASVRWLLDHHAAPDIVSLWTLGFQVEALAAMKDPRWLNVQRGPESTTPLHDAIRLNDRELVEMLLAAGADLTIRDSQWNGRPLDWARALDRPRLAALIERAM